MPIQNFDGETFVAFLDLCGFKELMRSEDRAWRALDSLYQTGYQVLRENHNQHRIEGIFVSDSGVLFVRRNEQPQGISIETDLQSLLVAIKKINKAMLNVDLMLTTSIAYGQFKYQERIEFVGIEKNPIYGNAYISAYFDNENGIPKIQPGQCRLVKTGLPPVFSNLCAGHLNNLLRERAGDLKHYYFYWNVENPDEIDHFEERYKDAYNLKYQGMLRALKGI